ncbi:MAG: hypothetical protein DWQ01_20550 [Planctomycetota bacterium]|nr:MAG: hypothetical protein DWQ01_20550 [Planctomycetota bacterium]
MMNPLRRPGIWLSGLVCLFILGTAWRPLPLPLQKLPQWIGPLRLAGEELQWQARRVHLHWPQALLVAEQVQLKKEGLDWGSIDRLELHLQWPRGGRLPFRSASIEKLRLLLERPFVERLLEPRPKQAEDVLIGPLALKLDEALLQFRDRQAGLATEVKIGPLAGHLDPGGWKLQGAVQLPLGHYARFWLQTDAAVDRWQLDLGCQAEPVQQRSTDRLGLESIGAKQCQMEGRIQGRRGQLTEAAVRVDLAGGFVDLLQPKTRVKDLHLKVEGRLPGALRLSVQGGVEDLKVDLAGHLAWNGTDPPNLRLSGQSNRIVMNDERIEMVKRLDPGTAEPLFALRPQGQAQATLALDWEWSKEPQWLVYAPIQEFRAAFHGFLESDGDRPAFPYPLHRIRGDLIASGDRILIDVEGRAQSAPLQARGAVQIGSGPAGLELDVHSQSFPVDGRLAWAVAGTPELGQLWRDLGSPRGGSADVHLQLRRPLLAEKVQLQLQAEVSGTRARPSFLPIAVKVEQAKVFWKPQFASFQGRVQTLGGVADLRGEVAKVLLGSGSEAPKPSIRLQAEGRGLAMSLRDRRVLQRYLDLPDGSANFALEGNGRMNLLFRQSGLGEAAALLQFRADDLQSRWQPVSLTVHEVQGELCVFRSQRGTLVSAPRMTGRLGGKQQSGGFESSTQLWQIGDPEHFPLQGRICSRSPGIDVGPSLVRALERLLDRPSESQKEWDGQVDGAVEVRAPFDRAEGPDLAADINLEPLTLTFPTGDGPESAELRGRIQVRGRRLQSSSLQLQANAGRVEMRLPRLEPTEQGLAFATTFYSRRGLELNDRFAALVAPEIWAAIQRIGLAGRVGADGLNLQLLFPEQGSPSFHCEGDLLLEDMSLLGPPRMQSGSGRLEVVWFDWRSPASFGGLMRLKDGEVEVSGLKVKEGTGFVSVSDWAVVFDQFEARTLGGTVRTFGTHPNGREEIGQLVLFLTPEAPLQVLLYLDALSLAQVRQELNLGGGLSGRLDGRIQFQSTSPSPLDYRGRGFVEVRNGVLGTVPVLADLFRIAGIRQPQFQRARVEFWSNPENNRGRMRIASYELHHQLVEVRGDGWVDFDGYVNANAKVRTLSVLTRIWPISYFVDLLVEHDVYGPVEKPVVKHRAGSKLLGPGERAREPFPLWLPDRSTPSWRRSPVLAPKKP